MTVSEVMRCSECEGSLRLPADPMEGEIVSCADCGASYELVLEGGGFSVRPAEVEGEDWGE